MIMIIGLCAHVADLKDLRKPQRKGYPCFSLISRPLPPLNIVCRPALDPCPQVPELCF